ncbi:putative phosphatidate phosphatase isoform X2 [Athalia rosae]|uniref:putative phosphatidate phosphatase isoform X2 n=1 Tax=Athalia rosae TaxID=37344 RepID=UPI002033AB01|nr:putative phosphatidate phosphatase isoform X2 [Athalia rosae]
MDRDSMMVLAKIIIDFLCVVVVGICILSFYLAGRPFERGFFCDDQSLMYPYHESTVTNWMLYGVGMILPICVMIFTEFINARKQRGLPERILFGWSIPPWVWNAYRQIGIFGFGAACTTLTTDIAKYSIGRLRPHFRHVCNTDACLIPANQNVYVEKFVCDTLKYSAKTIKESRLSFPSGHSSFAAYTMIYLILYLQLRIQWRSTKLLKHLLQFIFFFMAWFTALSRVSDYKHHWSDVMVGFLLGVTMALVIANFVANFFKDEVPRSREVEKLRGTEYENDATQGESSPLRNQNRMRYDGEPTDL